MKGKSIFQSKPIEAANKNEYVVTTQAYGSNFTKLLTWGGGQNKGGGEKRRALG